MKKEVRSTLDKLNKAFGANTIDSINNMVKIKVERISTGFISLDHKLGGGYPKGGFVEIYGPESSGKTTLTIHGMVQFQKDHPDEMVAFLDHEHAFDIDYAEHLGLDISEDRFLFSQPDSGDQGANILKALITTPGVGLVVVDSIESFIPQKVIDSPAESANVGLHARLMSTVCKQSDGLSQKNKTTVIWINQIREKIGVMFGSPETTPGGNSMKFHARQRLDIRKAGTMIKDEGGEGVGVPTKINVKKNKIGKPHTFAMLEMIFGDGFSAEWDLIQVGLELDEIKKSGAWYSWNGTKIAQGKTNAIQFLKDNPEVMEEIKKIVTEKLYQDVETEEA